MPGECEYQELSRRFSRLERRNRRTRLVLVTLLVPVVGLVAAAAYRPRVVTANEFVLKDEQGRPRARLGFSRSWQGAQLGLYDPKGVLRVRLAQSRDGRAGLQVRDESGAERAYLGYCGESSTAFLSLHDAWADWWEEDEGHMGAVYVFCEQGPDQGYYRGGGWLETVSSDGWWSWFAPDDLYD